MGGARVINIASYLFLAAQPFTMHPYHQCRGLTLCPVGLTGPQVEDEQVEVDDGEVR